MFGDELKNKENLLSQLNIAIVDPKCEEYFFSDSLDKSLLNESGKFKINMLTDIDELYKLVSLSLYDESKSLINMEWMDIVYNRKPSLILLYYYIKEGCTKEAEEITISQIIDKIRGYDQHIPIYLFIIVPFNEIDKYQHLKDDDKSPNSLRKKLKKEFLYVCNSKNILNTIDIKKLSENVLSLSRNYYNQVKNVLKSKKVDKEFTEQRIKLSIMIAVLSIIKSKKKNLCCSKYLKEAYDDLANKDFNFQNYYYGSPEKTLLNFYQVRAAADWVLFKILMLDGKKSEESIVSTSNKKKVKNVEKVKNTDIQFKIDIFIEHIKTFSSKDFGEKENDSFYFYKYFWMYTRYTNLSDFCDEHLSEIKDDKKYMLKVSQIKFYLLYSFIKLMKFYQKYYMNLDLEHTTINGQEIPISSISVPFSSYYGLPPCYTYTPENTENMISIEFNDDVFLKLAITKNDISLDSMDKKLKEELIKNILSFYFRENIFEKGFEISNIDIANEFEMPGIKLYLNLLRFYTNYPNQKDKKNLLQYEDQKDINLDLYKIFEKSLNIKRFPKIYIRFLNKNVEYFIHQMKNKKDTEKFTNTKKTMLFKSLSILSSARLLTEEEQDIYNELLNDEEFIPTHDKKEQKNKSVSLEINELFVVGETDDERKHTLILPKNKNREEQEEEKKYFEKYIKETDTVINLYRSNIYSSYQNIKGNERGIIFDYNIKNIDKYQERKILDLVEYEFKISTNLSKIKLRFENIKIFFTYTNQGKNKRYKPEILMKEYDNEFLSNKELTKETPIELEHKIFLKYREGKIQVTKILAKLFNKKDIIYSFDIPNDIQKVIFIKDVSTNVLNFEYKNNFKVGKNQYNPFILQITKEKNDEVEIKDLNIEFEALPIFQVKESNIGNNPINQNTPANSVIIPNKLNNNRGTKISEILGVNQKEIASEKRSSAEMEAKSNIKLNSHSSLDFSKSSIGLKNSKSINEKSEKRTLKSAIKGGREKQQQPKHEYVPPEIYIYNEKENRLNKQIEKFKISYNDFESLLNQGKTKYTTLFRFLSEGSYKIQFSVIYFIRHKKIEDYIEYREDQILDFEVISPFSLSADITSNSFYNQYKSNLEKAAKEEKKRFYFTNCKISINFLLYNKIEEKIKIKDIEIIPEAGNETASKYLNSYVSDLIHSYDLDPEEKNDMLIMQKNSSYTLPFETEFSQPYQGSIGKINVIWSTDDLDNFENGKLNILNKDEYFFPEIDVRPMDFEYRYRTERNNNDEILLELSVKNISNELKKITVYILNNNDNYDKEFILIGIDKQTHLIGDNEEIKFNYTLIPIGKGEFDYPCFQIAECDLVASEKKYINHFYSEKIAII